MILVFGIEEKKFIIYVQVSVALGANLEHLLQTSTRVDLVRVDQMNYTFWGIMRGVC